ncbi:MAG: hypothetical protein KY467_12810, partial [Gemmatimonadetes bacterium]|nr:hypothetical protein [Gemmatimonadota bacterium]
TLSPNTDDITIVLRWGATRRDLDSHLTGPGGRLALPPVLRGSGDQLATSGALLRVYRRRSAAGRVQRAQPARHGVDGVRAGRRDAAPGEQ